MDETQPPNERRHRQPGRRSSDARAFADAALSENGGRVFPAWTVGGVTKWLTLLTLSIGLIATVATFVAAKVATRQEVAALRESHERRFQVIESRQQDTERIHQLLVPMSRLQCLQMEQWKSLTLAVAAGLPCDSLLRRVLR